MPGFIKLHKQFKKWEWFDDKNMVYIFIYLMISANWKSSMWRGIEIKRGQLVVGYNRLSEQTNTSIQTLRTCLYKLSTTGEINIQSTNRFSIITICNYDTYNDSKTSSNTQLTNEQQADQQTKRGEINTQLTNKNNSLSVCKSIDYNGFKTPTNIQTTNEQQTNQHATNNDQRSKEIKKKNSDFVFDEFRIAYKKHCGGRVNGNESEFKNFKKHKDWKSVLPKLLEALRLEYAYNQKQKLSGGFVPQMKNLKTWINNRCWEQEFPEIETIEIPDNISEIYKIYLKDTGEKYPKLYKSGFSLYPEAGWLKYCSGSRVASGGYANAYRESVKIAHQDLNDKAYLRDSYGDVKEYATFIFHTRFDY